MIVYLLEFNKDNTKLINLVTIELDELIEEEKNNVLNYLKYEDYVTFDYGTSYYHLVNENHITKQNDFLTKAIKTYIRKTNINNILN